MLIGRDVRLLRQRKRWTQRRLAEEVGVSRWVVMEIEAGRGEAQPTNRLTALAAGLGAQLMVRIRFQGEGLDRLRDQRHAELVEQALRRLRADGWLVAPEVSFNHFGERGSIDILAFHPETSALLVIEVKSVVPDIGGMLATFDRKVRLARRIAAEQFGWEAVSVSRLLVFPEHRTVRRRVATHAATFDAAFPGRNPTVKTWLTAPSGSIAGLLFLPTVRLVDSRRRSRVRRASH
jgi:transcriptional regulator with XRE-family HTH domain